MTKTLSNKPTNDKTARTDLANGLYAVKDEYQWYVYDSTKGSAAYRADERYPYPNHAFVGTAFSLKNARQIASAR